ncbi:MAG: diguanylate cyclase, partial [Pseudomonadota bacterium]
VGLVVGRIHEAIARPFVVGGRRICIGASIGTCYADNPSLPAAELLARADNAMYVEKRRHHAAREGAAAIATPAAPLTATL